MGTALKIEHINKSYGKKQILHDVCLETNTGEVFGFLGPNGAGKTTLIKLIVGLISLDEGTISVCGHDVEKEFEAAMANIGGIVENPELYKYMTGMQNLKQYANMRNGVTKERIDEVVELVGLTNRINDKVGKYSLGMRQRLGLAQALLHNPKVLILDEPTNGLDPAGIKQLRDILKTIAHKEDVCVFVSSHLMSEMELMCDRVGIIVRGTVKSVQTIEEMLKSIDTSTATYLYKVNDAEAAKIMIGEKYPAYEIACDGDSEFKLTVTAENANELIADVNALMISGGIRLYGVQRQESRSLEEAFIELTDEGGTQIA
ncbi:MAG: ABC transporter ATP-binding protein [Lachnospiraceae bacterium]|nr:ABC transporter ATP-binding protein [Lachnospiraceae bacterium]